jgi:hypothetical protein
LSQIVPRWMAVLSTDSQCIMPKYQRPIGLILILAHHLCHSTHHDVYDYSSGSGFACSGTPILGLSIDTNSSTFEGSIFRYHW